MRSTPTLLLLASTLGLGACTRGTEVEIANNDSAGLVRAIRAANATPGHDSIRLARNGLYVLGTEAQAGLLLPGLEGDITIEGNHAEIRGYSQNPAALLQVEEGAKASIENLVLAEGTDGAVRNYGELRMVNVAIVDSSVDGMPAIVLNHGRFEATAVEVAYNLMLASRRDAGTVLNYGQMKLSGSRIHGNRVLGRYPTMAVAGGILNFGAIEADDLQLEDNELPDEAVTALAYDGILNVGNGSFSGTTTSGRVRDARKVAVLAGL